MKTPPACRPALRVSDQAVRARTGRSWPEWFATLDAAGASRMSHKEIVAFLTRTHGDLSAWWRQMVTVAYEQARGMRAKHQKPSGFAISVSKTMPVSAARLYRAWQQDRLRNRWLVEKPIVIRKTTRTKSIRITWTDSETSVEVNFYPKGNTKSQVAVQHSKLSDSRAAARMKALWAKALDRLRQIFET